MANSKASTRVDSIVRKKFQGKFVFLISTLASEQVAKEVYGAFVNSVFQVKDASFDPQNFGHSQFETLVQRGCDDGVYIVMNP